MEQLYAEAGCKPKRTATDFAMVAVQVVAAVICAGLILFSGQLILQIVGAAGIVALIFLFPSMNYEYEYVFCDGQIDFDKITGGNKRKTILRIDMENMEICAPVKASEVSSFQNMKTKDFSSKQENGKTYAAIVSADNEKIRVLFDPSEKMLDMMRMKSPRKIIRY